MTENQLATGTAEEHGAAGLAGATRAAKSSGQEKHKKLLEALFLRPAGHPARPTGTRVDPAAGAVSSSAVFSLGVDQ